MSNHETLIPDVMDKELQLRNKLPMFAHLQLPAMANVKDPALAPAGRKCQSSRG